MTFWRFVSRREFDRTISRIERLIMSSQADVDAITQQVSQVAQDLEAARSSLQQEIDQLAQQNPSVDLSALQAAVAPLDASVQALGGLTPTPPAAA